MNKMTAPPNFWKDAKRTRVTWSRSDPRLRSLIAGTQFPGLYALVDGDRVLKVGEAGLVRNGKQGTVGKRLKKHLQIHRDGFPARWEFSAALVGSELTIYTLRYDGCGKEADARRRRVEETAITEARGGVLWEQVKPREGTELVIPGTKGKRLVEPGAVRRRVLAELGRISSAASAGTAKQ
jgi:hypothetical protein